MANNKKIKNTKTQQQSFEVVKAFPTLGYKTR